MSADVLSTPTSDGPAGGDLAGYHRQRLTWQPAEGEAGTETTRVTVPLDYRDPAGRTIEIAVARRPAGDPGRRIGVLMIAPDDPGNRGIPLIGQLVGALPAEVLDRFDLVAFDHRFSGDSHPIEVDWTPEERLWVFHRPQSITEEIRFQSKVAAKVADVALDLLPYASTRNVARDMDVVRAALGEEKISYLGWSYGTYLGAVYTQLFGERADRVVLDSVLSPDWPWRGLFLNVAASTEAAVNRWCGWAAARDGELRLGDTAATVRSRYDELLDRAGREPLAVPGLPMPLDRFALEFFTVVMLTADRTYPLLGAVLKAAVHGEPVPGPAVGELMGLVNQRQDSTPAGQLAILCGESSWPRDLDRYEAEMASVGAELPFIGRTLASVKAGAFWPTSPVEPLTEIGPGNSARSILLVQSEADIFTRAVGAWRLRELLPENSRLVLAADTACHKLFPFGGHPVVNELTTRYLLTGELPERDVTVENHQESA
ncbi:Tripeptidyl aminopeptidase [Micromonospora sp. MH33]|uniref:alpha/beta fold hydrolase n=1 Tax=Micromonospora sp. MH33 TaxID=1945509 RepID=UPI000D148EB0|nr:alpha/beta fold hydrolase [Micromonospora sp. MH33]PSK64512.1 Tripeptidyl aminopeptidase [Micromonospora sp. MH33]